MIDADIVSHSNISRAMFVTLNPFENTNIHVVSLRPKFDFLKVRTALIAKEAFFKIQM